MTMLRNLLQPAAPLLAILLLHQPATAQEQKEKITDKNRHTAVAVSYHVICARGAAPCLPTPVTVGYHFSTSCDAMALVGALNRATSPKPGALPAGATVTATGDGVACYKPGSQKTPRWGFVVRGGKVRPALKRAGSLKGCEAYLHGVCTLCGEGSTTCKGAARRKMSPGLCKYEAKLLATATEKDRLVKLPRSLVQTICKLY